MPGRVMSRRQSTIFADGPARDLRLECAPAFETTVFDESSDFVDPLSNFAFRIFRRSLQPQIVDLGEHAVLARHPAVAEGFPVRFALDRLGFLAQGSEQLLDGLVQRRRGVALQFGTVYMEQ